MAKWEKRLVEVVWAMVGKKREDKNKDRVGSGVGEEAGGGGVGDCGEEAAGKKERRGSWSGVLAVSKGTAGDR